MVLASFEAQVKGVTGELHAACEFSEVFPKDSSDLQPKREVVFMIDPVLGTNLM